MRLVAKGFHMSFLVVVNQYDLELEKIYVNTAFLNKNLENRIIVTKLEGFVVGDEDVCLRRNSF